MDVQTANSPIMIEFSIKMNATENTAQCHSFSATRQTTNKLLKIIKILMQFFQFLIFIIRIMKVLIQSDAEIDF